MSYQSLETSQQSGAPLELFEFLIGGQFFRYTSAEREVTYDGKTWSPESISRGSTQFSQERDATLLKLRLPTSNEIAQKYTDIVPTNRLELTIYRLHTTDTPTPEIVTFWKGFVHNVRFLNKVTEFDCEPIQNLFSQEIPRQTYQNLCNHVLFDANCQVVKATFSDSVTVSSISSDGVTLVLNSLSTARPSDTTFYLGGYVERANGDKRLILDYIFASDTVRILLPFQGLAVSETVTARAGCKHSVLVCKTKFNNVVNYGGFPWIPRRNPFTSGLPD